MARLLCVCVAAAVVLVARGDMLARSFEELEQLNAKHGTKSPSDAQPLGKADVAYTLIGMFAADCANQSWFDSGTTLNVSRAQTTKYFKNKTFEVDATEYVGDTQCNPSKAEIFAKYNLRGTFQNNGASKNTKDPRFKGVLNGEWTGTESTWQMPKTAAGTRFVAALNQYCPCGGTWEEGTSRTVVPSMCKATLPNRFYICNLIQGEPSYGTFKPDKDGYIAGPVQFSSQAGYAIPPISAKRHKLPETGDHDPDHCTFSKWYVCKKGVTQAAKYCGTCAPNARCEGCVGLECDGCIYRFLPEDDTDNLWDDCCPCMHYFAERNNEPFMNVNC